MTDLDTNTVQISGLLARNPHFRELGNIPVCRLWVAVKGEAKTEPFNVILLGGDAEMCERHLKRDREVAVDGGLSRYVRDAVDDYHEYVFILAGSVRILGSRSPGEPDPLAVEGGLQVDFADLSSKVQELIGEWVAELTEQGL